MNIVNRVTLKGLKKNKTRTIVTIIGVILAAAMLSAVTILVSSTQNYLINMTIAEDGDWHGAVYGVSNRDAGALSSREEVTAAAITKSAGYAVFEGSTNAYKPYLHLLELDEKAFDILPVHLTRGRLPHNENEIIISEHTLTNGGACYQVGDTISLDLGERISEDGSVLGQKDSYVVKENGAPEKLVVKSSRTFTIVGMCDRLSYTFEGYSSPGYSVITKLDREALSDTEPVNIYFKAKRPNKIYNIIDNIGNIRHIGIEYNSDLLRYMGISKDDSFNTVLYSLGAILIVLIMIGSISLIYNSFSISVSERKKQFGLLSGAGATSKQLKHSVLFEAFVIAMVGIPLGVLSGILGIGVTLYFIDDLLASMMSTDVPVSFSMFVSIPSIITAVLVALATILISAWIPARRTAKISAMDAIRQSTDIKLTGRQVKTSRLTRKLFGIEGDLALKNMKRNRRRYRSTVISLFISVVLFVSASAFSMYLRDSVVNVYENDEFDISYFIYERGAMQDSLINTYNSILKLDSVNRGSFVKQFNGKIMLPEEKAAKAYYDQRAEQGMPMGEDIPVQVDIYSVDHDTFTDYVRGLGLEEAQFTNPEAPAGILVDSQHYYDPGAKKYRNTNIFMEHSSMDLSVDYWFGEGDQGKADIAIAAFADTTPFGIRDYSYNGIVMLIIDERLKKSVFSNDDMMYWNTSMFFAAEDPFKAEADIKKILLDSGLDTSGAAASLYNVAEALQNNRNVITIISVFSYGFIILISLITIANVFNTISTNVNLRRQEFAMLKSVGMTNKSFNTMLNYECIFYGLKALLYGIPVSILVTYLIYMSINEGVDMAFHLPVQGLLTSVLSVFLVVFISMMYSMSKIRNENILDALKNENL